MRTDTFLDDWLDSLARITINNVALDPYYVVSGANHCVGEGLTFDITGLDPFRDPMDDAASWTLPGKFVNEPDSSKGPLYYYMKPADLNRNRHTGDPNLQTHCWYVQGAQGATASVKVSYDFYDGGPVRSVTVKGMFNVFKPKTYFTYPIPSHGNPAVIITPDGHYLSLGQVGNQDMSFEYVIQPFDNHNDEAHPGTASYTQLLKGEYIDEGARYSDLPFPRTGSEEYALDNLSPYMGLSTPIDGHYGVEVAFSDSPSLKLPSMISPVSEDMWYQTYLLFQPAKSGSIAVPLRLVTWELHMSATPQFNQWKTNGAASTPDDEAPTSFPAWSDTYQNEGQIIKQ